MYVGRIVGVGRTTTGANAALYCVQGGGGGSSPSFFGGALGSAVSRRASFRILIHGGSACRRGSAASVLTSRTSMKSRYGDVSAFGWAATGVGTSIR